MRITAGALTGAILVSAAVAVADELPTIQEALGSLDGTNVRTSGYIGRDPSLDWIRFYTPDGLRLRVELAVDRPTLEAVEACEHNGWDAVDGCSVTITGAIRVKDDYFQLLVDSVTDLTPLE
jgi:hypothetical protein